MTLNTNNQIRDTVTNFDQIGVFPENMTYLSLNCAFSKHIDWDWFYCKLHSQKVTSQDCASCPDRQPLDPSIPFDSLMSVDGRFGVSIGFTLSNTERRLRRENPINVIDSEGLIKSGRASMPEGQKIPQFVTFSDGLLKSLAKVQRKGDVFDAIEIHQITEHKLSKLEGGE